MDRYKIDSHKLIYHIPRVHDWLDGKIIYPIYMEVSPAGSCNHRCTYCGLDFMGYKPRFLETGLLKDRISELGRLGLKSMMLAGEGEPFLHKDIVEIVTHANRSGIDVSITTNGVLFKKELALDVLSHAQWIKIGIEGATKDTYAKIHRCDPGDFDNLLDNISHAAKVKRKNNLACTLGVQMLLLPENYHEAKDLTILARDIGMDYIIIKPYSQHIQSKTTAYSSVKYSDYAYLAEELLKFDTDDFNVVFRMHTMRKWDEKNKIYHHCLAFPFWSYIDAGGNVWGCSVFLGDERFLYGNIYTQSYQQIWEGEKRLESLIWAKEKLDVSTCRVNCRMDEVNRYLWELKNPPAHVNFI